MNYNITEEVQNLLSGIEKGSLAAINFYTPEQTACQELAQRLEQKLSPDAIVLDVAAYSDFADLVQEMILQLLLREDKPEGCRVADAAIEEVSIRLLRRHAGRLLNSFGTNGAWICLILKNFDAAESYWDDSAFAWIRELVDSGKISICVVLSQKPISQVSEKPEGSSPLYNIFRAYPVQ